MGEKVVTLTDIFKFMTMYENKFPVQCFQTKNKFKLSFELKVSYFHIFGKGHLVSIRDVKFKKKH